MDLFPIIIILYIIFYIILAIVSATNKRKRKQKIKDILPKEKIEELEVIPEEKIPQEIVEEKPTPILEKEKITPSEFEKLPSKLKKVLSFSKNDILKGIIFKEILTPKFKK